MSLVKKICLRVHLWLICVVFRSMKRCVGEAAGEAALLSWDGRDVDVTLHHDARDAQAAFCAGFRHW